VPVLVGGATWVLLCRGPAALGAGVDPATEQRVEQPGRSTDVGPRGPGHRIPAEL